MLISLFVVYYAYRWGYKNCIAKAPSQNTVNNPRLVVVSMVSDPKKNRCSVGIKTDLRYEVIRPPAQVFMDHGLPTLMTQTSMFQYQRLNHTPLITETLSNPVYTSNSLALAGLSYIDSSELVRTQYFYLDQLSTHF
jgi:hypothetical protein